jgi:hypothetical protein
MRALDNQAETLVRDLANRVAQSLQGVDIVEVGNEPDLNHYWPGKQIHFVERFFAPFADQLRKRVPGVKIAAPSLGNQAHMIAQLPEFAAAVNKTSPDYVAVHLYADTPAEIKQRLDAYRRHFTQPLIVTEWDCQRRASRWRDTIKEAASIIRGGSAAAYYYRIYDRSDKPDWDDVSPLDKAGNKTEWFDPLREALR